MIYNKMTVCVLLLCLLTALNCKKEAPIENVKEDEPIQCEKDGVITIYMYENVMDTTDRHEYKPPQPVDSFFVSETEHRLVIENAIPLSIPKMNNVNYFFKGEFDGMADEVIVWSDYIYTSKSGRKRRAILADRLRNNHGIATLMRIDLDDTDPVRGYVFCLDKDDDNSGKGQLIISQEGYADTVWVDASKNTVRYPTLFRILSIGAEERGFRRSLDFQCPDRESFVSLNDGIIYFFTLNSSNQILGIGTSWSFGGIFVDDGKTTLNMYAFAPEFVNEKE